MITLSPSLISSFAAHLQNTGKLDSTVKSYRRDITALAEWLKNHKPYLTVDNSGDIHSYLEYLQGQKHSSHNSIRRKIVSIKLFFRYVISSQHLDIDSPAATIVIPPRDESLPYLLDQNDIHALLSHTALHHHWFRQHRDPALICLFAYEGVKTHEILTLTWDDLIGTGPQKHFHSLRIKGSRHRSISLSETTSQHLKALYHTLNEHTSGDNMTTLPMFARLQGRSLEPKLSDTLSRHGMKFLLYEMAPYLGLPKLHSELLRHHAINYQLRQGKSPHQVRQHLGLKKNGSIMKHTLLLAQTPTP